MTLLQAVREVARLIHERKSADIIRVKTLIDVLEEFVWPAGELFDRKSRDLQPLCKCLLTESSCDFRPKRLLLGNKSKVRLYSRPKALRLIAKPNVIIYNLLSLLN